MDDPKTEKHHVAFSFQVASAAPNGRADGGCVTPVYQKIIQVTLDDDTYTAVDIKKGDRLSLSYLHMDDRGMKQPSVSFHLLDK